jgi:hypothetical protein
MLPTLNSVPRSQLLHLLILAYIYVYSLSIPLHIRKSWGSVGGLEAILMEIVGLKWLPGRRSREIEEVSWKKS